MTLVRWNPWGELDSLHNELDRLFQTRAGAPAQDTFKLATDVHEDDAGYTLTVDLPGVPLQNVAIEVHESVLTVSGHRGLEQEDNRDGYRRIERNYGSFTRSFRLPKHVDDSKIDAKMKDGVLTIAVPKAEAALPRKISIQA